MTRELEGRPNAGFAGANTRCACLVLVVGGTASGEKLNADTLAADRAAAQAAAWNLIFAIYTASSSGFVPFGVAVSTPFVWC